MANATIYGRTTAGDYAPLQVDANGVLQSGGTVNPSRSATGTLSTVAGTTVSGTILASNASRLGAHVYNDSTAILYLVFGTAAASSTVFSHPMAGSAAIDVPSDYTGRIMGAWAANNGSARVTEFT